MQMRPLKRQIYKYPLFGLIAVGLSACGSGTSEDPVDVNAGNDDNAVTSPSVNPFDSPDEPADPTPADDDNQVQGESPEETQAPVGTSSDTSEIEGFWNLTRATSEGEDAVHVLIGPNGQLTEFDYQRDNAGDGRECYIVRNLQIISRGADQFDIQNDSVLPGSEGSEDVMIQVEESNIVFRFFTLIPAPEGGNELSPQSLQFPASDLIPDDLTACE